MTTGESGRLLAGRYRLGAVIGRGGMGAVWKARDELLNRDVAVKEIVWPPQMDAAERETARRRAVREAQLAARLRHPNVVSVYDIVEEDDRPSIVMELVPFRSLHDVVGADGPMPPAEAARVGLSILAALRAVHEVGVVHRDVKPANILLGPGGRVVLADFGIAKAADSPALTVSGVLLGSPSYLAPERARGGRAGTAADLWALGASLYAAVEGHPPFERDSVLASLTAVVSDELDPPSRVGPLGPVIEGLLRKDPATRLDVDEAGQMLRRIVTESENAPAVVEADDGPASAEDREAEGRQPDDGPAPRQTDPLQQTGPPQQTGPLQPTGPPRQTAPSPQAGGRPPRAERRFRARLAALIVVAAAAVIATGLALALGRTPGHQAATGANRTPPVTSSAPVSTAPAPAASPVTPVTSAPPPAATPGVSSSTLPAGYYRFTNSTGFSIGVPHGWQISHVGHYVYIRDPANSGIFLLIDQSDQPKANPLADWQQQAATRQGSYPDYHLILLRAVHYTQAEKAADWEFTYNRNGIMVEVLNRNILANAHHAYALYWSTPVSEWNADYHYFQVFAATFRPASASQA